MFLRTSTSINRRISFPRETLRRPDSRAPDCSTSVDAVPLPMHICCAQDSKGVTLVWHLGRHENAEVAPVQMIRNEHWHGRSFCTLNRHFVINPRTRVLVEFGPDSSCLYSTVRKSCFSHSNSSVRTAVRANLEIKVDHAVRPWCSPKCYLRGATASTRHGALLVSYSVELSCLFLGRSGVIALVIPQGPSCCTALPIT